VTATTLRVQWTGLTGRGRCGGDAQERVATNPVAALPCARPPLLTPWSTPCLPLVYPLLIPLLIPPSATVGVCSPAARRFGQVEGTTPAGRAQKPRATVGPQARSLSIQAPPRRDAARP